MQKPPNVLFLMDDQHRPDILGYAGDDVIRTPTLDWLAETGSVFTNAYTPSPLCVPARQSIRLGQLPQTWGKYDFEDFESPEFGTLPLQMARHGYMTASGGKEHYQGWNQMLGWRKRIGPTPMKQLGIGIGVGTNQSSMFPDSAQDAFSDQRSVEDWKWTWAKEIERAGVGQSRIQVQDRRVVEGIEQYIREFFSSPYYDRHQPDIPLLLKTSLIEPHFPFIVSDESLFTYYLNRIDPYIEQPEDFHPELSHGGRVFPEEEVWEREIRRATAAYYAMVETSDSLFGRVIDALEHHGEDLDEWVIIFASDHGEMLGERGIWGKKKFYEPSVKVPLIIRYPRRFNPKIIKQNVNLCDIYATICDLTNVPIPNNLDSRSLVPLLEYKKADWNNETISQYTSNASLLEGVSTDQIMIKHDELKYCYYGEDKPEVLFDLDQDPKETINFVDNPTYSDKLNQFRKRRAELGYGPNADSDYENAGYGKVA